MKSFQHWRWFLSVESVYPLLNTTNHQSTVISITLWNQEKWINLNWGDCGLKKDFTLALLKLVYCLVQFVGYQFVNSFFKCVMDVSLYFMSQILKTIPWEIFSRCHSSNWLMYSFLFLSSSIHCQKFIMTVWLFNQIWREHNLWNWFHLWKSQYHDVQICKIKD